MTMNMKELRKSYLSMEDLFEADFADKEFGGLKGWHEFIESSPEIQEEVRLWRRELQLRLKSEGLKNVLIVARDPDNKNSYNASKFLMEGGYVTPELVASIEKDKDSASKDGLSDMPQSFQRRKARDDFERLFAKAAKAEATQ